MSADDGTIPLEREPPRPPAPVRLVAESRSCVGCGYALRGVPIDGPCPECGHAVRRSLSDQPFDDAPRPYLRSFRRGALAVFGAMITKGLAVVGIMVAAMWSSSPCAIGFAAWVFLGMLALDGVSAWGWWVLTAARPDDGEDGPGFSGPVVRGGWCAVLATAALGACPWMWAAECAGVVNFGVQGIAGIQSMALVLNLIARAVIVGAGIAILRRLAERSGAHGSRYDASELAFYLIATALVGVACMVIAMITPAWATGLAVFLWVLLAWKSTLLLLSAAAGLVDRAGEALER